MVLGAADSYGYAIMKAIERSSGGLLRPEIGSLYRMIGRLERDGLVAAAGERRAEGDRLSSASSASSAGSPGKPRRYYRITDLGRAVLQAEADRLRDLVELAGSRDLLTRATDR